jgi:putative DNA primase/helicase
MTGPETILSANGIRLPDYKPGRRYTTCPQCSRDRKTPAHRNAECLGVTIEGNRVRWGCNHCSWTGPAKGNGNGGNGTPLTSYVYRGKDGAILFRKLRNAPGRQPRFWLQKWGGAGWEKGTKGVDTSILYRADEVAKAIADDREILIVEGEKDADRMWALGFAATCNAHGASEPGKAPKWTKKHSEQLRGAAIVVLNDHDAPGVAHALAVSTLSADVAKRVRRLVTAEFWPDAPKGGDISDWLARCHTRDELERLIAATADYQPASPSSPASPAAAAALPLITEQAVMRLFVKENSERLRYNHDSKEWLVWNRHYWKTDGKQRAFAWSLALCHQLPPGVAQQKIRFSRAVEEGARAQPGLATESVEWDQNSQLLGTPDGVVDLTTGKLRPGRRKDMISKITACAPAEDEDCPRWKALLEYAFDRADNIAFFKRFCGYSLTGSVEEEAILFLVGREGTGKGTITKTVLAILNHYGVSVPVRMFTDSGWRQVEYYKAQLHGKRLAIAAEPSKDSAW